MATLLVPLRSGKAAYRFTVELDDEFYELQFRWNSRDLHWFLDIFKDDTLSIAGVKVVENDDLLVLYNYMSVDGRIPPGTLRIVDSTGVGADPDTESLGDDVIMLYDEAS